MRFFLKDTKKKEERDNSELGRTDEETRKGDFNAPDRKKKASLHT